MTEYKLFAQRVGLVGITNAIVSLRGLIIMANSNFNEQEQNQMPDEDFLGESLRKIAKGAGVSFVGAFAGLALGYLSRMIIARWLGTSNYGLISLSYAAMMIGATLSLVDLPGGIQKFIRGKEIREG